MSMQVHMHIVSCDTISFVGSKNDFLDLDFVYAPVESRRGGQMEKDIQGAQTKKLTRTVEIKSRTIGRRL